MSGARGSSKRSAAEVQPQAPPTLVVRRARRDGFFAAGVGILGENFADTAQEWGEKGVAPSPAAGVASSYIR